MITRAVITGRGAVSPAGNGVAALWQAVRQGVSTVSEQRSLDLRELPIAPVAARFRDEDVREAQARYRGLQMTEAEALLASVVEQAVAESGIAAGDEARTVLLTSQLPESGFEELQPTSSYGFALRAAQPELGLSRAEQLRYYRQHPPRVREGVGSQVFARLGELLGTEFVEVRALFATGTTSLRLICEAARMIELGRADRAILAVVGRTVDALHLAAFARALALSRWQGIPAAASRPFDVHRSGFVFGEGAAALVLESEEQAKKRNAACFGRVLGWALASNTEHYMRTSFSHMVRVMRQALSHAEVSVSQVDIVDAMGSSSPIGDADEARAIQRLFGPQIERIRVTAQKAVLGYSAQVASLLELIAGTCSFSDGVVPPVPTCERQEPGLELPIGRAAIVRKVDFIMKNAFGMGGHYGSLVLAAPEVGA